MSQPVSNDTMQYYRDMNPQNLRFPFAYFHHTSSLSFLSRKEKPHKNFSDLLEDQILQPLRKVVEYKNLLGQLSTIQQQQGMILGGEGIQYPSMPSMTFDMEEFNNNQSEESSLDNENDCETVGYRGHVCESA